METRQLFKCAILAAVTAIVIPPISAAVQFDREFAPQEGMVADVERPWRDELCLNGTWQFQPVPVPSDYVRFQGKPPDLPPADPTRWESMPIRIPSPWNVNTWGGGRDVGEGKSQPYFPGSEMYPSYPESWDHAEMGWLRRRFTLPAEWQGRRLILHFEAVAGQCQVLLNGQPVGEHFDSFTPFDLDVTAAARVGEENELLVGVRRLNLFDKTDPRYPKALNPYPNGSYTDHLVGIWQDVSLLAVAPVSVTDTFVKPLVDRDILEVDVELANTTSETQRVEVGGTVAPWVNKAPSTGLEAPEPRGELKAPVLTLPPQRVEIPAGTTVTVTLSAPVQDRLRHWTPETPHLNGVVVSLDRGGEVLDRRYTRFGWRQFKIDGRDLFLNGNRIQVFADIVHPFGAFTMTRRYPWAWYRMVKDFGGNGVRIHAQPMPRFYLDLADEMGILVLDETALFGSSLKLNFAEPEAWDRFAEHYDALVLRDRNHPSVFGWSMGNELFAIFRYNNVGQPETDRWYAQLTELALRARRLDPTRDFITCDGDEDLRGTLPVWSKHLGHGLALDVLPPIPKPLVVGENGGTYYATPPIMAPFNGERAYESYRGRNEALAIDLYDQVTSMARPLLAYFSASEIVWFGLEPLPFGYRDFSRLPGRDDGVVFTAPFREGKFGYQPERLAPYASTLNPGYDPALPLYEPLPLFEAMKAALAPGAPAPSPWDHRPAKKARPAPPEATVTGVLFQGSRSGDLHRFLHLCGVPWADDATTTGEAPLLIVDSDTLPGDEVPPTRARMDALLARGGTVLVTCGGSEASLATVNALLPASVEHTTRQATMLVPDEESPWTAHLALSDLYFADHDTDKWILKRGLAGPFVQQGRTLLEAANSEWSLFHNGEHVKVGALALYEKLAKPPGAALVTKEHGGGCLVVSAVTFDRSSPAHVELWRKLLAGWKVKLEPVRKDSSAPGTGDGKVHDLLRDGPLPATP